MSVALIELVCLPVCYLVELVLRFEYVIVEIVPSALTRAWDRQWVLGTSLAALNNPPPPSLPPPLLCAFPEWQFLIILGNAIRSLTTGYGNRSLLECNSSSSQETQSVV